MAWICNKGLRCENCGSFRYDEDRGEKVCWGKQDEEKAMVIKPNPDDYKVILDYDDFIVVHSVKTDRYFYIEGANDPVAVTLVAAISPINEMLGDR